jgi:hypothetical protein
MNTIQAAARQAAHENLVPELVQALQWAASALQSAARDGDADELDVIRMKDGSEKKIAEILDMADTALGKAKGAQP